MARFFISVLFLIFILTSFAFAKQDLVKLQNEFGYDLTKAPFFLRFAYYKEFNKDWKKTDYDERLSFLTDYEDGLAQQQAREKALAKAEAEDEKERLQEKKDAERREKDRLKARLAKYMQEAKEEADRQKALNQAKGASRNAAAIHRRSPLIGHYSHAISHFNAYI